MRKIPTALCATCVLILGTATTGCQSSLTATEMLAPKQAQVAMRSAQTRAFDTTDRSRVMRTVIATLQDLEFVIDQGDETLSLVEDYDRAVYEVDFCVHISNRQTLLGVSR